jgi:hypothetical protein
MSSHQALQLNLTDLGPHVLAPCQRQLKPTQKIDGKEAQASDCSDSVITSIFASAMGLPAEFHLLVEAAELAVDRMQLDNAQPNLTSQAAQPNASWTASKFAGLSLAGAAETQKTPTKKNSRSFHGALKFG